MNSTRMTTATTSSLEDLRQAAREADEAFHAVCQAVYEGALDPAERQRAYLAFLAAAEPLAEAIRDAGWLGRDCVTRQARIDREPVEFVLASIVHGRAKGFSAGAGMIGLVEVPLWSVELAGREES